MLLLLMVLVACEGQNDLSTCSPAQAQAAERLDPVELLDEHGSCEALEDAFWDEAEEVRSCTVDSDCGQVLSGYGCGCTRDWVARCDSDPAELEDMGVALAQECDWFLASTCDCPETRGFACVDGQCNWNYR